MRGGGPGLCQGLARPRRPGLWISLLRMVVVCFSCWLCCWHGGLSSPTRGQTHSPTVAAQSLDFWTAREGLSLWFLSSSLVSWSVCILSTGVSSSCVSVLDVAPQHHPHSPQDQASCEGLCSSPRSEKGRPSCQGLVTAVLARLCRVWMRKSHSSCLMLLWLYLFLTCWPSITLLRKLFKLDSLWHPTPGLLPGKSHGWRSLVGCSPWGRTESDTTERLSSSRVPIWIILDPCEKKHMQICQPIHLWYTLYTHFYS